MLNFERSSLSQKLTIISVLSTGTALLLVFGAFAVTSVLSHREDEARQLASFASVIGAGSMTAAAAPNPTQAEQTLSALKAKPEISVAALFDGKGKLVAHYAAPGNEDALPDQPLDADRIAAIAEAADNDQGGHFWSTRMRLFRAIGKHDRLAAIVMIEADLKPMWLDIVKGLGMIGAAIGVSLLVAQLLAARFRGSIADPVTKLINAAQKVSASQNFNLRIAHERTDELGLLIDSFNNMLAQIEGRGNALANHRDELERQVGVRTEQLEKAKDAAEAASRAKSAFLATMSHEIRTPMNGVLGMTEMLLDTPLSEKQRNYTRMVKRSGEHLLVIINDILDFSKIEAGKLSVEYIHFNFWDLLDDLDHAFSPQAQAKGIRLEFDIANDIPLAICGDPNRLRQVLANLLGNAIKFTDHGQITVRIRVVSEDSQAVGLRFEVHDTGIGISREASSRIFEAFSQADGSTTRKYGGTGLGLAISKQLVELMGGRIGVDNALTRGSVFWFTVAFDKRQVDADDPGSFARTTEELRALVVDEKPDSREQLRDQLTRWRIRTDVAPAATDALDMLVMAARAGDAYDVAILDMELQRTSGLALAASIKAEPLAAPTRLLLLSSDRCAADPVQRREAGVAFQLIKPARDGDLFECLVAPARSGEQAVSVPEPAPAPADTAAPRARRRKVLLAEDNPVNVEVAGAMLDSLGMEVVCARNGDEALKAVRAERFDVVLMDCQMPVMDGFAATAEIRRHEQQHSRARVLPIIAITANALQGDREACLAAGMDDYLSKPFTQQDLGKVIGRWIALPLAATVHHDELHVARCVAHAPAMPRPAPDFLPVPDPASPPPTPATVLNRHALDNIRALSKDGGEALVQKVIAAYVDDTPMHLQTLRSAIAGLDAGQLRRAAHSLKSSSANVGADTLARMCKEMERLGRTDTTEGASGILTDMEQEFQAVRDSLSALLEKET